MDGAALPRLLEAAANRWAASWTLEGKVPALALLNPAGKLVGGSVEVSPGVVLEGGGSLEGSPPEAKARSAGGRYLAPIRSSASISRALFAYAAEGAGGGVFPDETLEKEPLLSEAESDIIGFEEMGAIRYY